MRKLNLFTLLVGFGLLLSACNTAKLPISSDYSEEDLSHLGDDIDTPWVDYSIPATSVNFSEDQLSISLNKGETFTYSPVISPKGATLASLEWSSSNSSIATIDRGLLIAVGGGEATIVVSSKVDTFNSVELKVKVNVPVTSFDVNPTSLDLDLNESKRVMVNYEPADTTQKDVTFTYASQNDSDIIDVLEDGTVMAKGVAGTATVRASSTILNMYKDIPVVVSDKAIHVEKVVIANPQATLEINKSFNMQASVEPNNASVTTLTYSSADDTIASVDNLGNVTAKNPGTVKITATSNDNGKFASFDLSVYEVKASSMAFEENDIHVSLNAQKQLHIVYYNANGDAITPSKTNVTYLSSDTSIATVNDGGLMNAKGIGQATITATDGTLQATANVTVDIATTTFIVTDLPDWITSDNCLIFAWVWGGSTQGSWKAVTVNGAEGTFEATSDITNFLLVRCISGSTEPNWDARGNETGRIYNKTADIDVYATQTSYKADEWIDYPEIVGTGFGFVFTSGRYIVGEYAGISPDNKEQYHVPENVYTAGEEFTIYDFDNKAGWVEAIDDYSFGGNPENQIWKTYITLGENSYVVNKTFKTDCYIKVSIDGNNVYFGETDEISGIVLDKTSVSIKTSETAVVTAANFVGALSATSEDNLIATASVNNDKITITPVSVGNTKINVEDDDNNKAVISVTIKDESVTTKDIYLNTKKMLENDNATLFVHDWNDNGLVETVKFTLVEGQTIIYKATVSEEATGLLIARCSPEATDIIWGDGDTDTNVYNVTDNLVFSEYDMYTFEQYVQDSNKFTVTNTKNFDSTIIYTVDDVTETHYYLKGVNDDWNTTDYEFTATDNENIYVIEEIEFTSACEVKANNPALGNSGWYGVTSVYDGCGYTLGQGGNASVAAGKYKVYLYLDSSDGNYLKFEAKSSGGDTQDEIVTVRFTINYDTAGKSFYLVGQFGDENCWDITKGKALTWTDGNNWTIEIKENKGTVYVFKFVVVDNDEIVRYEGGSNRTYTFNSDGNETFYWQN